MKVLKWAVLIAIIVAVIATIIHLRRDSIARGIANSIFSEQDLVVTELSVNSLATDRLELAELVVESESGTRYEILVLSLPLGISGTRIERLAAESLVVTYTSIPGTQPTLSTTLQTVLDVPLAQPDLEATIARISLPNLPELTDVTWATSETGQDLSFRVDAISIAASVQRQNDQDHSMIIKAAHDDGEEVLSADIAFTRKLGKYSANGEAVIRIFAWLPIFRSLDLIPPALESVSAEFAGPVAILLDQNEAGRAVFNAQFGLADELTATYRFADGSASDIRVTAVDQLAVVLEHPSSEWVARAGATEATLTTDSLDALPALIRDLECRSGIRCTMHAVVDTQDLEWNGYHFESARLSLPIAVELGEETHIDISEAATGAFGGVRTSAFSADKVKVISFSGTQLIVEEDSWHCRVGELQLAVDRFAGTGELVASFPVTFSDLDIQDSAETVDTRLSSPPIAEAAWGDMAILLPGAEGTTSISDEQLTSSLQLRDGSGALSAGVDVTIDLSTDEGALSVNDALVSFDSASVSELVPGWPYPLDVVDGIWSADLDIEWQSNNDVTHYSGTMEFELDSLAGKYKDIAFAGLSSNISARLDPGDGIDVSPSSLAIRLVDIGLPLENIAVSYTVDPGKKAVHVNKLSADALGGTFVADPFQYAAAADTNLIPLYAQSIQLQLMVDLLGSEDIEMSGAISGELPVTMSADKITIEDGRLASDPPGGVIRYQSDDGMLDAAVPDGDLNIVIRALSNFEFDSLTSDVDYTEAGDLQLQMRLSGINPDMDATQPIILNLNIENNVPQLLRSLQAIRSIEDILERQTVNQTP